MFPAMLRDPHAPNQLLYTLEKLCLHLRNEDEDVGMKEKDEKDKHTMTYNLNPPHLQIFKFNTLSIMTTQP